MAAWLWDDLVVDEEKFNEAAQQMEDLKRRTNALKEKLSGIYEELASAMDTAAGTTVYTGSVATQGGAFLGGGNVMQIFINKPWLLKGVEVLGQLPLS